MCICSDRVIIPTYSQAPFHSITLTKNPFSNLPTSRRKAATSSQQSSGRRSLRRKQATTPARDSSTPSSLTTSSRTLRSPSFRFRPSISFCTLARPRSRARSASALAAWSAPRREDSPSRAELGRSSGAEMRSWSSAKEADVDSERRASSAATRDWMCSSRSLERVLSV